MKLCKMIVIFFFVTVVKEENNFSNMLFSSWGFWCWKISKFSMKKIKNWCKVVKTSSNFVTLSHQFRMSPKKISTLSFRSVKYDVLEVMFVIFEFLIWITKIFVVKIRNKIKENSVQINILFGKKNITSKIF